MKKTNYALLFALLLSIAKINVYAGSGSGSKKVKVGDLYYYLHDKTAEVTSMPNGKYSSEYIYIPSSLYYNSESYSVNRIDERAFQNCTGLTEIEIPNSVTSIGIFAFYGCSSLTSVEIGGVTKIDLYAFENCSSLTSIKLSNSLETIGSRAFQNCTGLTSITIPNSVRSIDSGAFQGCSGIKSITFSNYSMSGGVSIAEYAFASCSSLTSITIPNRVTGIGKWAFSSCSNLTSVTLNSDEIISVYNSSNRMAAIFGKQVTQYIIGENVTSIGENVFEGCTNLTSVTLNSNAVLSKTYTDSDNMKTVFGNNVKEYVIGESVTGIGDYAFYGCSGLETLNVGSSVTNIGKSAFNNCTNLTSIYLNSDAIVSKKYNNSSNMKTVFGGQVTEYVIGNNVTGIGDYAFYGCSSLGSVKIFNRVTSIGNCAFYGCSNLTSVTVLNPTPVTITYNTFSNREKATLFVPRGSKKAYKAADYWKGFKEIIETDVSEGESENESGIDQIMGNETCKGMIYTIDGKRVDTLKKGLNVIRMKNRTHKVMVK